LVHIINSNSQNEYAVNIQIIKQMTKCTSVIIQLFNELESNPSNKWVRHPRAGPSEVHI